MAHSRARRLVRALLVCAASALIADQLVQWTLLRDGWFAGRRIAPFDPPLFTPEQQAALERVRAAVAGGPPLAGFAFDRELGWSVPSDGGRGEFRFDWAGARLAEQPLARTKRAGVERLAVLGDSFTLGDEVAASESWPARLDRADDALEVANLGLNAYGLDQSVLRLERDALPLSPDEIWLGLVPSTLLRVVTVYVPAWRHVSPMLALKPRFRLAADGELGACVHACASLAELAAVCGDADALARAAGADDAWIARAPAAYAVRGSSWTHWFATTRVALTLVEGRGRDPHEAWCDAASEPVRLASALVRHAARASAEHGARFVFLVLPDRGDLARRADWQPLLAELRAQSVACFDASEALLAAHADAEDACWAPRGHYSARGNAIVAEALARFRRERRAPR